MDILSIILISFGLAMDAFAVSISCGLSCDKKVLPTALKAGISFGLFQGGMAAIGWFLGVSLRAIIEPIDHWIAFLLLVSIGVSMLKESKEECKVLSLDSLKMLLTLSIATSIDALATGITFSLLSIDILFPVLLIGFITTITSFSGVYIGKSIGMKYNLHGRMDLLGGVILIIIGLKILISHLMS